MLSAFYTVDILDSAQEGFPHMWVNGEKYVFSEHVVTKGVTLFAKFQELTHVLYSFENTKLCLDSLKDILKTFDKLWCAYEQAYVNELIVIERDSRRYLLAIIDGLAND